jgi:NAD(P)H-dependent FMN reductase
MTERTKLAIIYGSTREGRLCDAVAAWAAMQIEADGRYDLIEVDPAKAEAYEVVSRRLDAADAFLVVTPEYNHSFPAPLKELVDGYGTEWHAKPVAFVSYGGISGGLRAVEHLRGVFAELHTVGVRDTVSFAGAWKRFGPDGMLRDPAEAERSMGTLLSRLHWWADALSKARNAIQFGEAA